MELKMAGITQKQIAKDLERSEFHISEIINKNRVSDKIMRHIAGLIKRHAHEVFPEYYLKKARQNRAA